ncbi:MAG: aminotransferase class V-fold PLP-dependent enzyme [Anaerolineales bacterium]
MELRQEIVGIDQQVPLLDGRQVNYVNLDNAASTPAFRRVKEKVEQALELYSSVHRGSGYKSLISTYLYDTARQIVLDFVGANPDHEVVIFGKNTTEAINKLANRFPFQPGDMVLTSVMEHHSNDLPWRARAQVVYADVQEDGSLDMNDLEAKLKKYQGKIKLVTITGASNVTGWMPPIYEIARLAHRHQAQIMVDCAQLLPHRPVIMGEADTESHLDFIAFSGHKVYAPYGSGALIGAKDFFNQGEPDYRGGGTIEMVTLQEVEWAEAPERDEAGSPNVIGVVALAAALRQLQEVGMETIAKHEMDLTSYALRKLKEIQGVHLYGSTTNDQVDSRVGVIPFAVDGMPHAKLAAILGFEGGIGVRNGCFCAHPYVLRLMKIEREEFLGYRQQVLEHNRADLPGFARASLGCYNNQEDINRLAEMLEKIVAGDYKGKYEPHHQSGSYYPLGFNYEDLGSKFRF